MRSFMDVSGFGGANDGANPTGFGLRQGSLIDAGLEEPVDDGRTRVLRLC